MSWSLRTKTISGVAVIEAILLLILIITMFRFMGNLVDEGIIKRAHTTASLFVSTTKNAVLGYDLASLESDVEELMQNADIAYVRILSKEGDVIVQRGNDNILKRKFSADTSAAQVNDEVFDTFAPINVGETNYGRVELGIDITSVQSSLIRIRNWAISIALIEMVLVALFSFVLGYYLTAGLKKLLEGTRKIDRAIANNNYADARVNISSHDELSELATAFNQLVASLEKEHQVRQETEEALRSLNHTLEDKIIQRTTLLSQKNRLLEATNQDLKEAQTQLLQAEKMASVGQLAAGVAHEINNPVGFVSSNLSTLGDYVTVYQILMSELEQLFREENPAKQQAVIKTLKTLYEQHDLAFINDDVPPLIAESSEGLRRVSEIVKGLKLFSRVNSDDKQWCDVNDCINTTLTMVNNKLKYICTLNLQLGSIPPVWMNVGKITQVLTNLLINAGQAIEATDRNGTITVTTHHSDGNVVISVADTGSGIRQEHIDKLFNPFFTTKPEGQGTGLGLSISFGIVEEHGGTMEVTSEEGKGSCFTLTLPVNPPDEDNKAGTTALMQNSSSAGE